MDWIKHLSSFGDSTMLLPLSLLLTAMLWRSESARAAICLLTAVAVCGSVMVALKIAFLACGETWGVGILTPSGHASMSSMVYGAFAVVVSRKLGWRTRVGVGLLCGLLVACIAVSRVVLGVHSVDEVIVGLSVGLGALSIFALLYFRLQPGTQINPTILLLASVALIAILHGVSVPFEEAAYDLALRARAGLSMCAIR